MSVEDPLNKFFTGGQRGQNLMQRVFINLCKVSISTSLQRRDYGFQSCDILTSRRSNVVMLAEPRKHQPLPRRDVEPTRCDVS